MDALPNLASASTFGKNRTYRTPPKAKIKRRKIGLTIKFNQRYANQHKRYEKRGTIIKGRNEVNQKRAAGIPKGNKSNKKRK